MTTAALNYLPVTASDFAQAFAFGMDAAHAEGITLIGVHIARHAGLELHTNSRADTETLADRLGLRPGLDEGETTWTRHGTADAGFPGPLIVTVYGPRSEGATYS